MRLAGWMVVDGEPPLPVPGEVLVGIGVRVGGVVDRARAVRDDGIVEVAARRLVSSWPEYLVTGSVREPRDVDGPGDPVVEFAIRVRDLDVHAQVPGKARDISDGARVTVRGRLRVIGNYEWEAFALTDVRTSWLVRTVETPDEDEDEDAALLDLTNISE